MTVYISGSLAYDRIMNFSDRFANHILPDKLHILNVCFLVNGLEEKFGGTAGNIAYSLALLGESPIILATAGNDFARYQQWLEKNGLPLDGIKLVTDLPTAGAYITTDQADNQITAFNPGAMTVPTYGQFTVQGGGDVLAIVSPGNLEDMQRYPVIYRDLGIPFIFDPGQNTPAFSGEELKEMIRGSAYLVVNDYELSLIEQRTGLEQQDLLQLTEIIVATLGEKGALVISKDGEDKIPAVKVQQALDPTGAGDAFRAGFIKGLILNKDILTAAKMGAVSASFCVECKGTQEHIFTQEAFWARYNQTYA